MLLRFIHTTCIWTTSCTTSSVCLSKAFQRTCFRFESGCKGKTDFRNHQIFRKVFSEKFFSGGLERISHSGPALSRSLAMCKVRYSVKRPQGTLRLTPCHQNFISSTRFLSKAVAKVYTFNKNASVIQYFFETFF